MFAMLYKVIRKAYLALKKEKSKEIRTPEPEG